jgi:DNA gyrase subunit B
MQAALLDLGLESARLVRVSDDHSLEGEELRDLLGLLTRLEEQVAILRRLGMTFEEFLARRDPDTGAFPFLIATYNGEERLFYSHVEFQEHLAAMEQEMGRELVVAHAGDFSEDEADIVVREFRERRSLERTVERLHELGFGAGEFLPPEEEEEADTICRLEYNGSAEDIVGLKEVLEGIRRAGKKGIDLQRYKGLGEMNPDQLRVTTMDPSTRKLIQVRAEDAMAADRIFSILMGPDVEPRREFIEKHALDVKDLDI